MKVKKIKNRIGYVTIILIFVIGIFYFFNHREYLDKSEYYELTRQLTPDKKYYIYHYARYGGMAFSSDITGYRLLEKEERFAENAGIVSKLEVDDLDKFYNSDNKAMVLSAGFAFIPNKSVLIKDFGETGYFLSIK
ncbi:hypothetical protein SAMN04487996_1387 [Dyadobacter soli]|uniref:Uncharacterized protein n=1 Tax=Dyadobacter soli TaxID=659014 RepID=A0A1G8CJW2_9BACT|nr:hypothetical protein [Dyadobacter soli]SDH45160.1 hypothetical protein SAMN04487996_1387 [Dyadobacter soli]